MDIVTAIVALGMGVVLFFALLLLTNFVERTSPQRVSVSRRLGQRVPAPQPETYYALGSSSR